MSLHHIAVAPQPASPYASGGYGGAFPSPAFTTATPQGGELSGPVFHPSPPPPQQLMSDAQCRPVVLPLEGIVPGVSRLLYHGLASRRGAGCMHCARGVMQPWTCACLPGVSAALTRARYVQVYDNKIEINEPDSVMVGCGTCILRDRISVVHFDRHLAQNAARAESCGPHCSHGDCAPDCGGHCGETLVMHSDRAPMCSLLEHCCAIVDTSAATHVSNSSCVCHVCDAGLIPFTCCFPSHKLVFGLDNATELAQRINTARQLKAAPRAQPPF